MMKDTKLKLLYLHNGRIDSGEANLVQVVSMCNAFSQMGYQITLMLNTSNLTDDMAAERLHARFAIDADVTIRLNRQRLPVKMAKHLVHLGLRRIIRLERPDLLFVRDPRYFRAALLSEVPVILEVHNTRMHIGNNLLNNVFCRWILRGVSKKHCLRVIFISQALKKFWVSRGVPEEKSMVLHDGFSPELFLKVIPKSEARKVLNLNADETIVVYSGNLQANRGIHYILDLAKDFPRIRFLLVGGSPDRKAFYEKLCQSRGIENIQFEGQQPHLRIPVYLYAADILLAMWSKEVPTINYCSPLKVFEYLATGIPMVIPGYPTILEVVEDGVEAFVCHPDDPESFREALGKALEADPELLQQMATKARQKATTKYSWETRTTSIIRSLPVNLQP